MSLSATFPGYQIRELRTLAFQPLAVNKSEPSEPFSSVFAEGTSESVSTSRGQVPAKPDGPTCLPGVGSRQIQVPLKVQGHCAPRHCIQTACLQNRGKGMFLASKIVCSGIAFVLMTPWISGPRPRPLDSGANLSRELVVAGSWSSKEPKETPADDVKEMQQTLQDKGHYGGRVNGVFGLRTRASIREFQKAVSLPVTGQLDVRTAGKLGVRPEVRRNTGYQTSQYKPSAGIEWARGSRRSGRTLQKIVKKSAPTVPPA